MRHVSPDDASGSLKVEEENGGGEGKGKKKNCLDAPECRQAQCDLV
jgi:hypothetical protein